MAKLTHAERSEISKKAWRERKPKAVCRFCGKPIWARGVIMPSGSKFHKGCAEAYHAGLVPAQVGKNPTYGITPSIAKRYSQVTISQDGLGNYIVWLGTSVAYHDYKVKFTKQKATALRVARELSQEYKLPIRGIVANLQDRRRRVPRDAFRFGARELNPREYVFGPTRFRPPAKWFAKMAQGSAASYFGKKLKELTKAEAAKVGQIVGGIWAKYSDKTRLAILRKYEPSAVRVVRNLSCPICGVSNPVSAANIYLRCSKCGTPLRSVKVRRR